MNLNMLVCWCLERSALCINSQINTEVSTRFRRTYFLLLLCNCFASSRKLNPKRRVCCFIHSQSILPHCWGPLKRYAAKEWQSSRYSLRCDRNDMHSDRLKFESETTVERTILQLFSANSVNYSLLLGWVNPWTEMSETSLGRQRKGLTVLELRIHVDNRHSPPCVKIACYLCVRIAEGLVKLPEA